MKEKHYIKKVLNNNVVFSKNKDGKDIILTGLGLGFQKKKGEFVDENKICLLYTSPSPRDRG